MKAALEGTTPEVKKLSYPKLKLATSADSIGLVVLFTERKTGVVVVPGLPGYDIGHSSDRWAEDCFENIEAGRKVTLSN